MAPRKKSDSKMTTGKSLKQKLSVAEALVANVNKNVCDKSKQIKPKKRGSTGSLLNKEVEETELKKTIAVNKTKRGKRAEANFEEEDQMITMMTEGLESEFMSTEEEESSDEEDQITFKRPENKTPIATDEEEEILDYNDNEEIQDKQFTEMIEATYDQTEDGENRLPKEPVKVELADLDKEDRQRLVDETFARVQEMMVQNNYNNTEWNQAANPQTSTRELGSRRENKGRSNELNSNNHANVRRVDSLSDATIYKGAVRDETEKRGIGGNHHHSLSSEDENINEKINSSDELIPEGSEKLNEQFIADQRNTTRGQLVQTGANNQSRFIEDGQHPSCSRQASGGEERRQTDADDRADKIISDTECAKAKIFDVAGKMSNLNCYDSQCLSQNKMHSAIVDEEYQLVSTHIDEPTQEKIARGEYA